jgi:streptomycin 6-kinase
MLTEHLTSLNVSSRSDLIFGIQNILGKRLDRIIDTHNTSSVIFIYHDDDAKLLLKAEFGNGTATHSEVDWYKLVSKGLANQGVDILDSYQSEAYALLLINYIDGSVTVDELAASGNLNSSEAAGYINRAIRFDYDLFNETSVNSSKGQVDKYFIGKYRTRRAEAESFPYLADLFANETIIINQKRYRSPDAIIHEIANSKELHAYLTPKRIGLIHGDLHCGNILTKGQDAFFIDPNGSSLMPIEYDIGKLLHSIHGNYGAIMRGEYNLIQNEACSFEFEVASLKVYETALLELKNILPKDEYIRGLYAEALHFATMLPHHASAKQETIALFLRSVQLFNELMNQVEQELYSDDR